MDTIAKRLRHARIKSGHASAAAGGRAAGVHVQQAANHEAGRRGVNEAELAAYAEAYGVGAGWLLTGRNEPGTSRSVPVVGYVGARAVIYTEDDHAKGAGLEEAEVPPGADANTVAVIVRGTSMLPAYREGTLIFYSERLPPSDLIGEDAVVGLADGTTMLKRVMPGRAPGRYTLDSTNAEPILDAEVEWAAPIDWIKPGRR